MRRVLSVALSPSVWLRCLLVFSVARAQTSESSTDCVSPTDPKGVGIHENGAIYVVDSGTGIRQYKADGSANGVLTADTDAEGGLEVVDDAVFVAPASASDGTVQKFDLSGVLSQAFSDSGSSLSATPGGYDVAVAADGSVFVSNFLSDGVEVYDGTTGEYLRTELEDTHALGIAFGPDGLLYATINADDEVRRFMESPQGGNFTLVDAFINGQSGSRIRSGPWGVAVNQDDYLIYVCWAGSKEVTEYSQSGAEMRWWFPGQSDAASNAQADDDFDASVDPGTAMSPWYVAVDEGGDIYVSAKNEDATEADVFVYDGTTGDEVGSLGNCLEGTTATTVGNSSEKNTTVVPSPSPSLGPSISPTVSSPAPSLGPTISPTVPSPAPSLGPTISPTSIDPASTTIGPEGTLAPTLGTIGSPTPSPVPAPTAGAVGSPTASPAATMNPSSTTPNPAAVAEETTPSPAAAGEEASASNGAAGRGVGLFALAVAVLSQVLLLMVLV